jgi:hypothetical protein
MVPLYCFLNFWKRFLKVNYKNDSFVQNALMVGNTDPNGAAWSVPCVHVPM